MEPLTETQIRVIPLRPGVSDAGKEVIGAKAWHLIQLMDAGYPVPGGIVIPAGTWSPAALENGLPEGALETLRAALRDIGDGPWAVRSSGVSEDGDEASFAGQFQTYLNVQGDAALSAAILGCLRSAESAQIRNYKGSVETGMAVIIQQMVPAECAGVAFSAHPVTGERDVVMINAVPGLGDKLVSGEVTPEEISVRGEAVKISEKSVLSAAQTLQIARTARELAARLGGPQDIEWAIAGDKLHLLQSRPITALPPEPIPIEIPEIKGTWERDDHHLVPSTLGWELWHERYGSAMAEMGRKFGMPVKDWQFRRIGGQTYMRIVPYGGSDKPASAPPPKAVMWLFSRLHPTFRKFNRIARKALENKLHHAELTKWDQEKRAYFKQKIMDFAAVDRPGLSNAELSEKLRELKAFCYEGADQHAIMGGVNIIITGELQLFGEDHLGWKGQECLQLMNGHSQASSDLLRQIAQLCETHLPEGTQPPGADFEAFLASQPEFARAWAEWLELNQYRVLNYDLAEGILGEQLPMLHNHVRNELKDRGKQVVRPDTEASKQIEATAYNVLKSNELKRRFKELLTWARRAYGSRDENGPYTVTMPFGVLRLYALEAGRRLHTVLQDPEDIFHLRTDEICAGLAGNTDGLAEKVRLRKGEAQWARLNRGPKAYGPPEPPLPVSALPSGLRKVFRILDWMGQSEAIDPELEKANMEGEVLRGTPIFAGTYTGIARVIEGPADFGRVAPGEILVCRITTGEWSIVFNRIGGLVTEEGGLLSHPAIIAREFGIPAVVGTMVARQRIRDGQRIRVDGAAGTVTLLD